MAEAPDASKAHPSIGVRILQWIFSWIHLRRDHDALVTAYGEMVRQSLIETAHVQYLNAKLRYYEHHIPRMRELGRQFEEERAKLATPGSGTDLVIPANRPLVLSS